MLETLSGKARFERDFTSDPSAEWNFDGQYLSVTVEEADLSTTEIIDAQTGEIICGLPENHITAVAWHPFKNWLAVTNGDELIVYDAIAHKKLKAQETHASVYNWSPDASFIALKDRGILHIWQVN